MSIIPMGYWTVKILIINTDTFYHRTAKYFFKRSAKDFIVRLIGPFAPGLSGDVYLSTKQKAEGYVGKVLVQSNGNDQYLM